MELFIGALIIAAISALAWVGVLIADMLTRDEEGYPKD